MKGIDSSRTRLISCPFLGIGLFNDQHLCVVVTLTEENIYLMEEPSIFLNCNLVAFWLKFVRLLEIIAI